MINIRKSITLGLLVIISLTLSSCANTYKPTNPKDPLESYNRKMFQFNQAIDKRVFRPIAITYSTITPKPLQTGVRNFFSNIDNITAIGNDILQGNVKQTLADSWRFLFNTTIGIGGLFDVAKHLGLPKHNNDFGITMAKWGVRQSPYFIIPFVGPSTTRDTFAFLVDYELISPWPYIKPPSVNYALYGLRITDKRAALLISDPLVEQAFDPYIFVRNAYLQYRDNQIQQALKGDKVSLPETYLSGAVIPENSSEPLEAKPLIAAPQVTTEKK